MWLSCNILSKMVDLSGIEAEDLALRLTMSTAEIDSIEHMNQHLKTIRTAKILSVKPHPDADKLTLVELTHGDDRVKVVCGAPNHRDGDIVCLADTGTDFGGGFVIKKAKIRGEESNGMLCSEKEMGIGEGSGGIMILPADTPLGVPMSELMPEWCDIRLEIDNKSITHRPDLWSHRGFAREIGALFGRPVKDPVNRALSLAETSDKAPSIEIQDHTACPRYSALVMSGIKVAPSPSWLAAAVTSMGMRPINNIVDVTNYVMGELGEPLHAFDIRKLRGNTIQVRFAANGEDIVTLDGQKHSLTKEDIVISDSDGPVALAGVMGGENSEISDDTESIVLEAANFNPVPIRKTAQRCGLRTDASVRFEKSISPELTEEALLRCCELIQSIIPGAESASQIIDSYPVKQKPVQISISTDQIRNKLGETISDEKIISILESLSFEVKNNKGMLNIVVPYYRATKDISIDADIVEEIGRIYGYDNIEPEAPLFPCVTPPHNLQRTFEREVKNILSRDLGMIEVSGYSFTGEEILNRLGINEDLELRLKNSLTKEHDRLNRTLVPNLIKNIESNQRYNESFSIYECGRVYIKDDRTSAQLVEEKRRVTGAFFSRKPSSAMFYHAKSSVLGLIEKLRIKDINESPVSHGLPPYAHPARSLEITAGGERLALIFELHPKTLSDFDIAGRAALFDLDLDLLFRLPKKETAFSELQKYPDVPLEFSIVCPADEYAGTLNAIITKSAGDYVKSSEVVSVYTGERIDQGKKSISFRLILAAKDRTLEHGDIERIQKKIISDLEHRGYKLR